MSSGFTFIEGWLGGLSRPGVRLLSIGAAVRALLDAGGIKIAVLAVVPIVLLAPPALVGIRALLHRGSPAGGAPAAEPTAPV